MNKATEWITAAAAGQILDAPVHTVYRLMRSGVVTTRRLPGRRPRLLRSDVDRIAKESIVPATK